MFLNESGVPLYKLLMFTICNWCHLYLELSKVINEAVKLVISHYHFDVESVFVVVGECSLEKFVEGFGLHIQNSLNSGEVQVSGNGREERNSIDEEGIHPEADIFAIVKNFVRDWHDIFPYMRS